MVDDVARVVIASYSYLFRAHAADDRPLTYRSYK